MTISSNKILITGGDGQLANALGEHLPKNTHYCLPKHVLDITDLKQVRNTLSQYKPVVVINTAAYTHVDKAESEKELADKINHHGARHLAIACEENGIPLIHLSTDYVFDGSKLTPYLESDQPQPINYYGQSKLNGELAIQQECKQALILRVSGVFSQYKQNFLKTMCHLAETREELRIIHDQITCPTFAGSIAQAIAKIIHYPFTPGIFHFCGKPPVSWYDFATSIIEMYKQYNPVKVKKIMAIPSSEYVTAAKRPTYSALNCQKIYDVYHLAQPNWHDGITESIRALYRGQQ